MTHIETFVKSLGKMLKAITVESGKRCSNAALVRKGLSRNMYRRMKDLREDSDLRQKDVAEVLNISRSAYANYERGERDMYGQTLENLADFYGTSVDYIMGRTDIKNPYPKGRKRKL